MKNRNNYSHIRYLVIFLSSIIISGCRKTTTGSNVTQLALQKKVDSIMALMPTSVKSDAKTDSIIIEYKDGRRIKEKLGLKVEAGNKKTQSLPPTEGPNSYKPVPIPIPGFYPYSNNVQWKVRCQAEYSYDGTHHLVLYVGAMTADVQPASYQIHDPNGTITTIAAYFYTPSHHSSFAPSPIVTLYWQGMVGYRVTARSANGTIATDGSSYQFSHSDVIP